MSYNQFISALNDFFITLLVYVIYLSIRTKNMCFNKLDIK